VTRAFLPVSRPATDHSRQLTINYEDILTVGRA
jgi:hypothetical protein